MTNENETKRAAMVVYYLPSKTTRGTGLGFKVPAMMRRHGFVAFDGSCWFGHLNAVVGLDFAPVEKVGGRWHVVTFVEEQWADIRNVARLGLEKDVNTIRASIDQFVAEAGRKFEQANREQSVEGVKQASRYFSGRLRRAKKRLNEAVEAALIFDLMGDTASLFDSLRTAIAAQEETSAAIKATAKARARAAKRDPDAPWGLEQIEMEVDRVG